MILKAQVQTIKDKDLKTERTRPSAEIQERIITSQSGQFHNFGSANVKMAKRRLQKVSQLEEHYKIANINTSRYETVFISLPPL